MTDHHLKILPEFFEPVWTYVKTFEIRKNDRNFQVGDILYLNEWNSITQEYTGSGVCRKITYITDYGQQPGYVVMAIVRWDK